MKQPRGADAGPINIKIGDKSNVSSICISISNNITSKSVTGRLEAARTAPPPSPSSSAPSPPLRPPKPQLPQPTVTVIPSPSDVDTNNNFNLFRKPRIVTPKLDSDSSRTYSSLGSSSSSIQPSSTSTDIGTGIGTSSSSSGDTSTNSSAYGPGGGSSSTYSQDPSMYSSSAANRNSSSTYCSSTFLNELVDIAESGELTSTEFFEINHRYRLINDTPGKPRAMDGPLDMTVPELLQHWAERRPNTPAFVFIHPSDPSERTVLTFQDLYTLGSRCAALLRSKGVRREDVVLVLLANSPERAVVEAALLLINAFCVTCNCQGPNAQDLVGMARTLKATAVVLDPEVHAKEWEALRGVCQLYDPRSGVVTAVRLPHLYMVLLTKRHRPLNENDFLYFLANVCLRSYHVHPAPFAHQPCSLLATSGSSSAGGRLPRFAIQTHQHLVAFSKIFMPTLDSPRPNYFNNYPFGSTRGHLSVSLCTPITRILFDERDGPPQNVAEAIYETLQRESCLIGVLPPSVVKQLAIVYAQPETPPPKLQFVGFIGEEVSRELLEDTFKFSVTALLSYVSAELLMASVTIVKEGDDLDAAGAGCPVQPQVMVRIKNEDDEDITDAGTPGRLFIRSPLLFLGYLEDKEVTNAVLDEDGYFNTGDKGCLQKGRLKITEKGGRV